jgi:hypothetical protein
MLFWIFAIILGLVILLFRDDGVGEGPQILYIVDIIGLNVYIWIVTTIEASTENVGGLSI